MPSYYLRRRKRGANMVWFTTDILASLEEARRVLELAPKDPGWEYAVFLRGECVASSYEKPVA